MAFNPDSITPDFHPLDSAGFAYGNDFYTKYIPWEQAAGGGGGGLNSVTASGPLVATPGTNTVALSLDPTGYVAGVSAGNNYITIGGTTNHPTIGLDATKVVTQIQSGGGLTVSPVGGQGIVTLTATAAGGAVLRTVDVTYTQANAQPTVIYTPTGNEIIQYVEIDPTHCTNFSATGTLSICSQSMAAATLDPHYMPYTVLQPLNALATATYPETLVPLYPSSNANLASNLLISATDPLSVVSSVTTFTAGAIRFLVWVLPEASGSGGGGGAVTSISGTSPILPAGPSTGAVTLSLDPAHYVGSLVGDTTYLTVATNPTAPDYIVSLNPASVVTQIVAGPNIAIQGYPIGAPSPGVYQISASGGGGSGGISTVNAGTSFKGSSVYGIYVDSSTNPSNPIVYNTGVTRVKAGNNHVVVQSTASDGDGFYRVVSIGLSGVVYSVAASGAGITATTSNGNVTLANTGVVSLSGTTGITVSTPVGSPIISNPMATLGVLGCFAVLGVNTSITGGVITTTNWKCPTYPGYIGPGSDMGNYGVWNDGHFTNGTYVCSRTGHYQVSWHVCTNANGVVASLQKRALGAGSYQPVMASSATASNGSSDGGGSAVIVMQATDTLNLLLDNGGTVVVRAFANAGSNPNQAWGTWFSVQYLSNMVTWF